MWKERIKRKGALRLDYQIAASTRENKTTSMPVQSNIETKKPGMVIHTCYRSIWEVESEKREFKVLLVYRVGDQPGLHETVSYSLHTDMQNIHVEIKNIQNISMQIICAKIYRLIKRNKVWYKRYIVGAGKRHWMLFQKIWDFQHPCGSLQPAVTPASWDPRPSSVSIGRSYIQSTYTHADKPQTRKIKIKLKNDAQLQIRRLSNY